MAITFENNVAKFRMHIGGQDVTIPGGVFIDVSIDCNGVTLANAVDGCLGGISPRVQLQDQVRALSTDKILNLSINGLNTTFEKIRNRAVFASTATSKKPTSGDYSARIVDIYNTKGFVETVNTLQEQTRITLIQAFNYAIKLTEHVPTEADYDNLGLELPEDKQ